MKRQGRGKLGSGVVWLSECDPAKNKCRQPKLTAFRPTAEVSIELAARQLVTTSRTAVGHGFGCLDRHPVAAIPNIAKNKADGSGTRKSTIARRAARVFAKL
jgi:hypothetical protein